MRAPWSLEELVWAKECAAAGDTFAEIAAWADRDEQDVAEAVKVRRTMRPHERQVAELWASGATVTDIAQQMGRSSGYAWYICELLRGLGYAIPRRAPEQTSRTSSCAQVQALLSQGVKRRVDIAQAAGISASRVTRVIRDLERAASGASA